MFSIFRNKRKSVLPLMVDVHSHLLPGIDDGVKSLEQSIELIQQFYELGFSKLITTPHIIKEYYPNTPQIIREKLAEVQMAVKAKGIPVVIEAAAEYYLEDMVGKDLTKEEFILLGPDYLLFETSYINEPAFLKDVIFNLLSMGLKPVLAHPERYVYLQNNSSLLHELVERGALLQININSLSGYYSGAAKKLAEKIIDLKWLSFLGTDCHNQRHMNALHKTLQKSSHFKKALDLDLLNNNL